MHHARLKWTIRQLSVPNDREYRLSAHVLIVTCEQIETVDVKPPLRLTTATRKVLWPTERKSYRALMSATHKPNASGPPAQSRKSSHTATTKTQPRHSEEQHGSFSG